MAQIEVSKIRNVGIIGHGAAGKTTLCEALLFATGVTDRMGRVEDGNTVTDFEPEEISRQFSICTSLAFVERNGIRVNLVDTPGYANFLEDTRCAMSAVDGAVIVAPAIGGIKAETIKVWDFAAKYEVPSMVYISCLDKENTDFREAVNTICKAYGRSLTPIQLPIGSGESFSGVIDLVRMKAITGAGAKAVEGEIPADMQEQTETAREVMIE